jgi:hypothetical protein
MRRTSFFCNKLSQKSVLEKFELNLERERKHLLAISMIIQKGNEKNKFISGVRDYKTSISFLEIS